MLAKYFTSLLLTLSYRTGWILIVLTIAPSPTCSKINLHTPGFLFNNLL